MGIAVKTPRSEPEPEPESSPKELEREKREYWERQREHSKRDRAGHP